MSHTLSVRDPDGEILTFRLERAATSLGRADGNDVRLPYSFVSARHLILEVQGRRIFARDLGSSNGTRLDGERLEPHVPSAVEPGQALTVGPLVLSVDEAGAVPSDSLLAQPSMLWQLQTGLFPAEPAAPPPAPFLETRPVLAAPVPVGPRPAATPFPVWLAVQAVAGLSALASLIVLIAALLL